MQPMEKIPRGRPRNQWIYKGKKDLETLEVTHWEDRT